MSEGDVRNLKIAIISPSKRQGCTTLAVLLGLMISSTQKMSVCLTHAGTDNNSINSFLGNVLIEDKTRSLEQISKLVTYGTISNDEINDYTQYLADDFSLMETAASYLSSEGTSRLLLDLLKRLNHNVVICDVDTDLHEESTQAILRMCDIILVCIEQSSDIVRVLSDWKRTSYYDVIEEIGELFIISRYDRAVSSPVDFAKRAGLNSKFCLKLTNSPAIKKMSNSGQLSMMASSIRGRSLSLMEVNTDLERIIQLIFDQVGLNFTPWTSTPKKSSKEETKKKVKDNSRSGRHS